MVSRRLLFLLVPIQILFCLLFICFFLIYLFFFIYFIALVIKLSYALFLTVIEKLQNNKILVSEVFFVQTWC